MERVFIIPYRDKKKDMDILLNYFDRLFKEKKWNSENTDIIFSHQKDKRPFNRGATKNIGFLYVKNKYKNYKNIDIIFNDIDIFPKTIHLPYSTELGKVEHYYGYKQTLGGIFVIKGQDFETIGGFPNFWYWGWEDNELYNRCIQHKIEIDRNIFYPIFHKEFNMIKRIGYPHYSPTEFNFFLSKKSDTFRELKKIKFIKNGNMLDITYFQTKYPIPNWTKPYFMSIKNNNIRGWNLF